MQPVFKANKVMVKAINDNHPKAYHRTFNHFVAQPNEDQLEAISDLLSALTVDQVQAMDLTTTAEIVASAKEA